jgi:hypothetical protein
MVEVDAQGRAVPGEEGVELTVMPLAQLRGMGVPIAVSSTTEWDVETTRGGRPFEGTTQRTVRSFGALKVSLGKAITVIGEGAPDLSGRPTASIAANKGTRADNVYQFTDPGGAVIYGYYGSDGGLVYTPTSPFAEGLVPTDDGRGGLVVRMAVPSGATSFNPYDAIDDSFKDPAIRAAREDVTTSSTIAFALSTSRYELKEMKTEELDALLRVEALSKPNPDEWYAAFKAEATKLIAGQVKHERVYTERSDYMNEGARPIAEATSDFSRGLAGARLGRGGAGQQQGVSESEFRMRAARLLSGRNIGGVPIGDTSYMNPNQLRDFVRQATGNWMTEVIGPAGSPGLKLAPQGRESDFATRNRPLPAQVVRPALVGGASSITKPIAPVYSPSAPAVSAPKPAAPPPKPPVMPTQQQAPAYYASEKLYAAPVKPKVVVKNPSDYSNTSGTK